MKGDARNFKVIKISVTAVGFSLENLSLKEGGHSKTFRKCRQDRVTRNDL